MSSTPLDSRAARERLVEALQLDLIGPENDHACASELLPDSPYKWYLTGYLVPTNAPESQRFDPTSMDDIDQAAGVVGGDDDQPVDRSAGGKSFMPSSIGMSVLVGPEAKRVTLRVLWGDYHWESEEDEASDAPDPDADAADPVEDETDEHDGVLREPGTEYRFKPKVPSRGYRRESREEALVFDLAEVEAGKPQTREVPNGRGLTVSLLVKPLLDSHALGLPSGSRAVSAFLVNYRKPDDNFVYRSCVFQATLELECDSPLLPQPDLRGLGSNGHHDWDERLADLQYRGIHEFSTGHGIATRTLCEGGICERARTTWLPSHEVERVAASTIPGVEFRMKALGEMDDPNATKAALAPLVAAYREWIKGQKAVLTGLGKDRLETAETALNEALEAADRMGRGIEAVCRDAKAFAAFRFANRAMARSASKRMGIPDPAWRPFQLAFVLLNLPGLIDDTSPDREKVDLLFFPTGGGKTEAYLGLAAFTLVLRRLRHEGPMQGGLSVLMRYTLRLLTLDQLGRAAGVVCALELERENHPELGKIPFEIGLWVGSAATPNRMGGKAYKAGGREYTAYFKLNQFRQDSGKPSPIPLENCPWCGTKFGRNSFKLTPNEAEPDNLVIRCEDRMCDFSGQKRNLPILSVDEPIYRRLPAFLIATVDKFAALPWEGRAGALLGHVDRHDADGFYGEMDAGVGSSFGGPLPGPDLVIQDELHLISGPLGTIAGVYETAIDNLSSRKRGEQVIRPKIIASTATVRRADRQIEALFGRPTSKVFPPPGPDLRDTFFAKTERIDESNGRLYLGVAAQGRSLKVVLMRAALALLCAGKKLYDEAGGATKGNPVDPYMTLMGYFNSLRELGGSRRIIEDEVVSRAQKYGSRKRRDPKMEYFKNREVDYEPQELTSRVSTAKVAATKRLLDRYFDQDPKEGRPVDVALATNMISVGLDISRLGLMVVLGQPKSSAEYIQATSRVGRNAEAPGLVVTLLNVHKPRDRSHYEHFAGFHRTFYRAVEATSVTPFSPRALDRALAASLIAVCRHSDPAFTPALGASAIMAKRQQLEEAAKLFAKRAEHHDSSLTGQEASELHDHVLHRCRDLLDSWLAIQQDRQASGSLMQYQAELKTGNHPRLLHDFLEENLPVPASQFRKFRANRSMRDVEPSVELVTKQLQEPLNFQP
jgi:hypothetical protein